MAVVLAGCDIIHSAHEHFWTSALPAQQVLRLRGTSHWWVCMHLFELGLHHMRMCWPEHVAGLPAPHSPERPGPKATMGGQQLQAVALLSAATADMGETTTADTADTTDTTDAADGSDETDFMVACPSEEGLQLHGTSSIVRCEPTKCAASGCATRFATSTLHCQAFSRTSGLIIRSAL
mmetsp:Transcript_73900/g.123429  ORF Transcript_73900/g.123429 Transcript_73900/m.123429 type:complete len:179 (+) Transcript_73900:122-658(+)